MTRWAALSLAAVAGTAFVLWQPPPLADRVTCPGLFDLIAIIVSRTWRHLPLASLLIVANAAVSFLALLLLARAAHGLTSSIVTAITVTLVAAASPQFAPILAPSAVVVFLAILAAWNWAHTWPLFLLSLVPAVAPSFAVPAVVLAASVSLKRGAAQATLKAVTVIVPLAIVQAAMPQGPASSGASVLLTCVFPLIDSTWFAGAWRTIGSTLTGNPIVTVLAALGLVARAQVAAPHAGALIALTLATAWSGRAAPLLIALWLLAGLGLAEIRDALNRTTATRVGAVILSAAIVVLQFVGAIGRRPAAVPPDGHDRLTLSMMTEIVGALPKGAALVEEDAIVDLLTRALPQRMRSSDRFRVLPRHRDTIATAMAVGPVFALPRSQRVLQHLGFDLAPPDSGIPGLAVIRQANACTAELGTALAPLPFTIDRQTFALVADDARSYDHAVIVLTGNTPVSVIPVDWPPESLRGLDGRMFDLTVATDRADFTEELRTYEIPSSSIPAIRHVSRIEAWRTPGAPLVLPLIANGTVTSAIARALNPVPGHSLRICPTTPFDIRPLAQ